MASSLFHDRSGVQPVRAVTSLRLTCRWTGHDSALFLDGAARDRRGRLRFGLDQPHETWHPYNRSVVTVDVEAATKLAYSATCLFTDSAFATSNLLLLLAHGGEGREVRVCPCVTDISFPSIRPLPGTSNWKLVLFKDCRCRSAPRINRFYRRRPFAVTSPSNTPRVAGTFPGCRDHQPHLQGSW